MLGIAVEVTHENFLDSASSGETDSLANGAEEINPEIKLRYTGNLYKWTNFMNGWQERYFILKEGVLSYYRNSLEEENSCRGSLKLKNAFIYPNDTDDSRFEVRVSDSVWYLRGRDKFERDHWIEALQSQRRHLLTESGYGSEQNLACSGKGAAISGNRQRVAGSRSSLRSVSMRSYESGSMKRSSSCFILKEKLAELETFKEIMCQQLDGLQVYFDKCSSLVKQSSSTGLSLDDEALETDLLPLENSSASSSICSEITEEKNQMILDYVSRLPKFEEDRDRFFFPDNVNEFGGLSILEESDSLDLAKGPLNEDYSTPRATTPKQQPNPTSFVRNGLGIFSRLLPFSSKNQSATEAGNSQKVTDLSSVTNAVPMEAINRVLAAHGFHAPDFKAEAHTFKATSAGILANLSLLIEKVSQSENDWRLRLSKEQQQRKRLEEALRATKEELAILRLQTAADARIMNTSSTIDTTFMPVKVIQQSAAKTPAHDVGPDPCENGDVMMREEEFYDAIDAHFDKIQKDEEKLLALKTMGNRLETAPRRLSPQHPLYGHIEKSVADRIRLFAAAPRIADLENMANLDYFPSDSWQIILHEGPMIVYNKEMESADGLVLDPLQAIHTVDQVTAKEMCSCFWDVRFRLDWEITIDQAPTVLEVSSEDTIVMHQIYKRVWPATQRDSLMYSHIRPLDVEAMQRNGTLETAEESDEKIVDAWLVINMSTKHREELVEVNPTQLIRLDIDVVMICQTVVQLNPGESWNDEFRRSVHLLPRERFKCRLFYAAQINPGGWAPAGVVRQLARREYPRFLKRFSAFVQDHAKNSEPSLA